MYFWEYYIDWIGWCRGLCYLLRHPRARPGYRNRFANELFKKYTTPLWKVMSIWKNQRLSIPFVKIQGQSKQLLAVMHRWNWGTPSPPLGARGPVWADGGSDPKKNYEILKNHLI